MQRNGLRGVPVQDRGQILEQRCISGSMKVQETEVEGYLRKRVNAVGGMCVKFVPDYSRGFPDRVLILPQGKLVWVETKTEGGRVAPYQNVVHVLLRRLGQQVEVAWTKDQVDALMVRLGFPGGR